MTPGGFKRKGGKRAIQLFTGWTKSREQPQVRVCVACRKKVVPVDGPELCSRCEMKRLMGKGKKRG